MVKTIDAKMLSKMFLAGAKNLEEKKEWINELNVFPGAGRRYRNQYDLNHYGCREGSGGYGKTGYDRIM